MKGITAVAWTLVLASSCNPLLGGLGTGEAASVGGSTSSAGTVDGTMGTPNPSGTSNATSTTASPDSSGAADTITTGLDSNSGTTGEGSSGGSTGESSTSESSTGAPLDCRTPMPSGQSLPVFDCACEEQLMSMGGGTGSSVTFINNTGSTRWLYWIDFMGNRALETEMPDGASSPWITAELHPWVVTDDAGVCITIYMPQAGDHDIMVP